MSSIAIDALNMSSNLVFTTSLSYVYYHNYFTGEENGVQKRFLVTQLVSSRAI